MTAIALMLAEACCRCGAPARVAAGKAAGRPPRGRILAIASRLGIGCGRWSQKVIQSPTNDSPETVPCRSV